MLPCNMNGTWDCLLAAASFDDLNNPFNASEEMDSNDNTLLKISNHEDQKLRSGFRISVFRMSVYVDIGAVRLYRDGKASGWHAGVFLAAPTVNAAT